MLHKIFLRHSMQLIVCTIATLLFGFASGVSAAEGDAKEGQKQARPNIIFILADDLGYGDLGCYGQERIKTPNIDRLASEGMRFTQCYAGSTVCAPSRCTLMTGLHTGHCSIRGNARVPVTETTVAEILKGAGYTTGLVGKWGLGELGSSGQPRNKGFDYFFGYLNQGHAHNYYPDYLIKNEETFPLPENVQGGKGYAAKRVHYTPDLFTKEALAFVDQNKDHPFFLYLSYTQPHANNERGWALGDGMEVPSHGEYANENWPEPQKGHAAMITHLDRDIGTLLDRLAQLRLADNTVVFFSSDNGPHKEGGADPAFFTSWGKLKGYKRDLTEGGIRVPMIVAWPGHIKAGSVSDHICAFWDFLPTAAQLAGVTPPQGIDGISMVPTLLGEGKQPEHPFMYWEFHERGSQFAVRMGDWKAIRYRIGQPLALYNLKTDLHEDHDVAAEHPEVVTKIEEYLKTARTDSTDFPLKKPGKDANWDPAKGPKPRANKNKTTPSSANGKSTGANAAPVSTPAASSGRG